MVAIATVVLAGRKLRRRILRRIGDVSYRLAGINEIDAYDEIESGRDPAEILRLIRNINITLEIVDRQRQYANNVSHELRNPLSGLRVELEEAQLHPEQTDIHRLVKQVLQGIERLEGIVADLLFLGRIGSQSEGREVLDLGEIARQEVLGRDGKIPIRCAIDPGVMTCAVRAQISRLLTNLLDNAQRYAEHFVDVEVHRRGDMAELAVSDDGEGIPEKDRERVFERFTRLGTSAKRDGPGTGLGLAIARDVAKTHSGTIHVEPSATGGARFVFQIPISSC
ncbi:hypothetical protein GCM10022226_50870 [Sphaerisporangium flaviroseum]|uniref:histidine kinase n=1 Tax=Sphaerisporangium flaviroseum TaxID=509199 RepID=A0ABP7IQL6_9ACTN